MEVDCFFFFLGCKFNVRMLPIRMLPIIYDRVNQCNGMLCVSTLQMLKKLSLKCDKGSLDIKIFINVQKI